MICMNSSAQFYNMISSSRNDRKYYTGKKIKLIIEKCLSDAESLDITRRRQIESFNRKYIQSKQPLLDDKLYCLSWTVRNNFKELKCIRKPEL